LAPGIGAVAIIADIRATGATVWMIEPPRGRACLDGQE
jgi:hypothetical protein